MNKSDLIAMLSEKKNITWKDAERIIDSIFDGFTKALTNGDRIEIRGFGSFSIREYESYTGRNPRTGNKVKVKSKKLPFFKVGNELKKTVAKKQ